MTEGKKIAWLWHQVAAAITKEVFNPLAKLTKGLQNVVLSKGQAKNEQVIKLFFLVTIEKDK